MLVALTTFTVASVLVVLLPGPDTLVVVRNLMTGGRRLGLRAALGAMTGLAVWVAGAAYLARPKIHEMRPGSRLLASGTGHPRYH